MTMRAIDKLDELIQRDLRTHRLPAAQYAIARDNEILAAGSFGDASDSSRFSIMSASKPVFAFLVLRLISERLIALDTPIASVWPKFAANGKAMITVQHLLSFTAGIPDWWPIGEELLDRDLRRAAAEALAPSWRPGSDTAYHPVSAHWVLAELVMRVTGMDHRHALRELVLDPLGLPRLQLGGSMDPSDLPLPMIKIGSPRPDQVKAVLGIDVSADELDRMDDRAMAHSRDPAVMAAGVPGAGMISDASSLALFHQHLLHDPSDLWDAAVRQDAISCARNRFPEVSRNGARANRSAGCLLITEDESAQISIPAFDFAQSARLHGTKVSTKTFGQGGAGGQIAFTDPVRGISFVYLTNGFSRDVIAEARRSQSLIDTVIDAIDLAVP